MGPGSVAARLNYNAPAPSATALVGAGALKMPLPGEGQLTLRLPYIVGQGAAFGAAELKAGYEIAHETQVLPNVSAAALVELPTAPGMRGAHPGVKATAAKKIGSGLLESIHVESELRTDGPNLNPCYRAAIGTSFRLGPGTSGSLDFINQQAGPRLVDASSSPETHLTQLGLKHKFDASTGLRLDLANGVATDARSLRATIGIERRF